MKSKRRKRVIASVLCMVLMLSTGMSTLAEADAGTVPAVEETTEAQTTAQETKSTSTDAQTSETETQTQTETENRTETKQTEEAAQTKQEETTAAQTTEEASGRETTQTETDQTAQNTQGQTTSTEISGTETQNETVETQTEETETTTKKEETQETKEEEKVSPAFSETYENSEVTVKVTAKEGIVPEGAKLSVTPIVKKEITDQMSEEEKAEAKKINAQYDLTEKKLSEDCDKNKEIMEGFLAYDISFLVDGKEVEPSGDVKVVIDFKKAAVPEGVSEDSKVSIKHMKEDVNAEKGIVVEDMGEKADVQTTEKTEVKKVEFTAGSFSVFTIGWTYTEGDDSTTGWKFKVEVVDTEGKDLQGDCQSDGEYYPQSSANVEDLARFLIGKKGIQKYKLEYVTINNWEKKPDSPITKMGVSNDRTYYRTAEDDKKNNYIKDSDTVIFVFSERPELDKVDTEDTISKGIRIDVFDYQVGENGQEDTTKAEMKQSGINKDHTLKFISDRMKDEYNSSGLKTGEDSIIQELLKDKDVEVSELGYPILKNDESLKYLFDETSIPNIKSAYLDVNNLFKKNENGYYIFDSAQNYAYLDKDSREFEVYNQPGSGFFPFTTTENMFEPKTVQENAKIGGNGMNHYLGMTVTSDFLQPENGQIQGTDGTLQNMRFDFTGDDDVWVYIDGVLVMDLGGIHAPERGWIDFSTGEVSAGGTITSIHDRFTEALGDAAADLFEQIPDSNNYRFKDFSYHTIKFFYLERGNDQSNCSITFNLQTVPEGSVLVTKEVKAQDNTGINKEYLNSLDFQFQIEKMNESGQNEGELPKGVLKGQSYTILQDGMEVGRGITDSQTGIFTLKAGQTALFEGFLETDQYQVRELGAYLDGYQVDIETPGIELENPDGGESQNPTESWSTATVVVNEVPSVIFTNTANKTANLKITKQMDEFITDDQTPFKIEIKIQGKVYRGEYTIVGEKGSKFASQGYIELRAEQTAIIQGLPYGVSYEVKELTSENDFYIPIQYQIGDKTLPSETNKATGSIESDETNVTVINGLNPDYKTRLTVRKAWIGDPPEDMTVTIQLYKNGVECGKSIVLSEAQNGWTHTFTDLDYYTQDGGELEVNQYTVKETYIGDQQVDENGMANGYISNVGEIENNVITITNTPYTPWQIIKVSSSDPSNSTKLGGAIFTLTKEGENSPSYYGKSKSEENEKGVIQWYSDQACATPTDLLEVNGKYELEELISPDGYAKSNEKWILDFENGSLKNIIATINGESTTLAGEMVNKVNTYYFKNDALFSLPSAGGPGIFWYTISGALLLMAGTLILYKLKKGEVLKK